MRAKSSKSARHEVEYTSKPVTGWGGLEALSRFWDGLDIRGLLRRSLPDGRTSNNQIDVVDMAMQLIATVLTGGSRFSHVERVRADEVIRQIVGAKRFGSASPVTSYFGNFSAQQSQHLQEILSRTTLSYACARGSDVLDLDSTVFTRYGEQEGSAKGYNPHRRGARSHRPLLAMFAAHKTIVHTWLRDGSTNDRRGTEEFLRELLSWLPDGFTISAVRADAGFMSNGFLAVLEQQGIPYAIRMPLSRPHVRWCAELEGWRRIGAELEIAEGIYTWSKSGVPRRVVVTRRIRNIEREGLFPIIDYEYAGVVSSLDSSAEEVWRFYNGRSDCENRIKELKYDFNADGFCLRSFHGTEAVLRLICFTYNVLSLFKAHVLRDTRITLGTIRPNVFVIGAILGSSARRTILRLGLTGRWRAEFDKLLERATQRSSTRAWLKNSLDINMFDPPTPWRLRSNTALFASSY